MRQYQRSKGEFEDSWEVLHIDDARKHGFIPYFGPCAIIRDGWMVQNAINDIRRNGRDKSCVVKFPGSMVEVWIIPNTNQNHPAPYIFQPPEAE
jgi:hypothetical protein